MRLIKSVFSFQVTANDQDQGVNSLIQYSINRKQSDKDRFFRIDANTGLISLDKRLDFDRTQVHEIVVVARDGGVVPQETSAFVTVRLTKDRSQVTQRTNSKNRPTVKLVYANGRGTVPENSPVGSAFAQVTLAGNSGDLSALNFDLSQSERVFELTKNGSGLYLATLKKLDFEKQSLYTVTIDVTDPVQPVKSFQETIDIAVEDHNDHAPVFKKQSYSAFVEESVEPGSSVIQVQATDEDEGHNGEVTYSLQYSGSEASDWFQVDEQSGLVTTQTFLDCETESQPKVIIVASDNGYHKLSSTATLSVSVNDVNDNQPLFEKSFYEAEVPENMSPGDCFLNVKANDLDCGQNAEVKYRIKESTSMFSVEEKTGKICLMEELDHERQEVYGFTVIATDRGSLSTSTMVKVDIKDINDNFPQFKPEQYITKIRSRFPTGVNILTVNAFDGDSGMAGTVRYEMVSGNEDGQFNLDKTLGKISLAKPLAARDHFQLVLDVFDGEGLQGLAEAKVMIIVDDDDLTFKMPQFHFEIYEDVSPYSEIGKVEAKTGQRGARMEIYESNVERYVSIDPLTGILRTEARMDHERHPEVILNIRLEDNAQRTESFCQVVVSIKDVNDNAPEFGSTTAMATIAEDFPVGRSIYIGKAIDADSGKNGDIIYSLASGPGKEYFSIDRQSGQVTLMKPLDFESQQEHKVLIEAEDMGSPSLKSTLKLLVHVHDVNDNKPHFEKDFFSVNLSESHPINTPVVTIKARDADHGRSGKISYSVSDNQYVSILQSTGVLILKKPLDRESKKSVDVTVTAKDHGVPSLQDTARVQLLITDRNDNSPSFEDNDYRFSTIEGLPYGTFVGAVRATDQDEGINGNVEYDFKNSVENFVINKVTGRISTGKVLDREEIDQYELIVEATDLGRPRRSSQTVVIIVVEDINDNPPRLVDPQNRMLYIQQGSGIGTIIGKLHAEDPDSGNTRITYKVLGE